VLSALDIVVDIGKERVEASNKASPTAFKFFIAASKNQLIIFLDENRLALTAWRS
jgi:hypothetical protein